MVAQHLRAEPAPLAFGATAIVMSSASGGTIRDIANPGNRAPAARPRDMGHDAWIGEKALHLDLVPAP